MIILYYLLHFDELLLIYESFNVQLKCSFFHFQSRPLHPHLLFVHHSQLLPHWLRLMVRKHLNFKPSVVKEQEEEEKMKSNFSLTPCWLTVLTCAVHFAGGSQVMTAAIVCGAVVMLLLGLILIFIYKRKRFITSL